jgi:hypothetical protein
VSDEAKVLLKHPDPRERALALKLDSITPADVARGILDPSPLVWKKAFHHPQASHALDVLAASNRDAAGFPLHDRHDVLLNDPRCTDEHRDSIYRAVQNDAHLPVAQQAARLSVLKLRSLTKKEGTKIRLANADDPLEKVVAASQEENRYPDLLQHYNRAVNSTSPIHPQDADLFQQGVGSPKVIYHVPHEGGIHKFIVKPYMEADVPLSGWGEGTSQELYHAAAIPHLHQKSFVGSYDNGDRHIPVSVIHMEAAKPVHHISQQEVLQKNSNAPEEARKIAIFDFLTGNGDRHTNNLMVRPNGQLLAIDHGRAFDYKFPEGFNTFGDPKFYTPTKKNKTHLKRYSLRAPALLTHSESDVDPSGSIPSDYDYHKTLKNWWVNVSPDVRRAFEKRLQLVQSPAVKRHLMAGFTARHQWLDRMAGIEPEQFQEELKKSVETFYAHQSVLNPEPKAKKYDSVHQELLNSHPAHLQPKVNKFEQYINHPSNPVVPEAGQLDGIEKKALVKHGTKKYLLKAASTPWNPLSGWGEMTSQAMYHAGGIGHLHQHVHATNLNIKEGGNARQQPAVVIHFQPGKWRTLGEVKRQGRPGEGQEFTNKNKQDLAKIYAMDFLTGNRDRHSGNLLVGPMGQPQAIDQGFAFRRDNWSDPEEQKYNQIDHRGFGEVPENGAFNWEVFANYHELGVMGDAETHHWWQQNKEPIVKTFNKHMDMIPDKDERDRRRGMFDYRVKALDDRHPLLFSQEDEYQKSEDLSKGAMARLHPFNPQKNGTPETYAEPLNDWVADEQPHAREQLGLMGMEPNAKARALHKLHASTEVRRNPTTNEREFLLHRGFGATQLHTLKTPGKYDSTAPRTDKTKSNRAIPYTSWSVDPNETHTSDHMVSAWIPESKIAFHIPQYNKMPGLNETTQQLGQDEKEAIVEPGQYDIFHQDRGKDWLFNLKQKLQGLHKALRDDIYAWTNGGDEEQRTKLGLRGMPLTVRKQSLNHLSKQTKSRVDVNTGEKHYLLHRTLENPEAKFIGPTHYDNTKAVRSLGGRSFPHFTSWSPDVVVPSENKTHIVSSWVPESHISFHIPSYGRVFGGADWAYPKEQIKQEGETIVAPGKFEILHHTHNPEGVFPPHNEATHRWNINQKINAMSKSLGNASYLHDQHTAFPTQQGMQANMKDVHQNLMAAHPATINPHVRAFELAVNQSRAPIRPIREQKELEGVQPKALYEHNGHRYLVKPAVENSTALGAWNEMASQGIYHAGNVGHLHQKVHSTVAKTGLNRSEPAHAVVVHMAPDSMTLNEAGGWEDGQGHKVEPKDMSRVGKMFRNPEHMESLRRIGMLDYLTGNGDRHGANIVIAPDGSPLAIDHGRSWFAHRKHALGKESSEDLVGQDLQGRPFDHEQHFLQSPGYSDRFIPDYKTHMADSVAAHYGGEPTPQTWAWWHENKDAMANEFRKYLNMLPDAEQRKKMHDVFMLRHNRLSNEFSTQKPLQSQPSGVPLESAKTDVDLLPNHSNQGK